jgi:hypothetical protein
VKIIILTVERVKYFYDSRVKGGAGRRPVKIIILTVER